MDEDLKIADTFMNTVKDEFYKVFPTESKGHESMLSPREMNEELRLSHAIRMKNDVTVMAVTNWRLTLMDKLKNMMGKYDLTNAQAEVSSALDVEEKLLLNKIGDKVETIIKKHTNLSK